MLLELAFTLRDNNQEGKNECKIHKLINRYIFNINVNISMINYRGNIFPVNKSLIIIKCKYMINDVKNYVIYVQHKFSYINIIFKYFHINMFCLCGFIIITY